MVGSASLRAHLWGREVHTRAELQEPLCAPLWQIIWTSPAWAACLLTAGCGSWGAALLAQRGALINGVDVDVLGALRHVHPPGIIEVPLVQAAPQACIEHGGLSGGVSGPGDGKAATGISGFCSLVT